MLHPHQQTDSSMNIRNTSYTPLIALCSLFFLWGFITVLNDMLIPQLKTNFNLNYTQAMLIQFCFFMAYFVVSIPSGYLIKRIGYKKGLQVGLFLSSIGCFLFYPSAQQQVYSLFLLALFILASGIAIMQVAANPYITALGSEKTAASRLSFAASCNSLGTAIGPQFGALLILTAGLVSGSAALQTPYLILGSILLSLSLVFQFIRLPDLDRIEHTTRTSISELSQAPHLYIGAWAIFFYVGAEVSLGSFMVNYITSDTHSYFQETQAAQMLSIYWGGAMVGRFLGAIAMRYLNDKKVLAFNALIAISLLLITMMNTGSIAIASVLTIGLCNSIMFPAIFSSAIYELKELTSKGSGLLCTAIVGGAIVPLLQGIVADIWTLKISFIIPVISYGFIFYYAWRSEKLQIHWLNYRASATI